MRQLTFWSIGSIVNAALISLPLWFLEEGGRAFLDAHILAVVLICTLWVGCDHSVVAALAPRGGLGRDHRELVARFPQIAGLLTLASIWLAVVDFASHAPAQPARPVTLVVGFGLALAGLAVRFTAIKSLAEFFTERLIVLPSQPLVTSGLYRRIRHPSYAGWLLILLGVLVLLESGWAVGFYLIVIVPMVLLRISIEETVMVEAFGEAYVRYKRETKRLVPHLL